MGEAMSFQPGDLVCLFCKDRIYGVDPYQVGYYPELTDVFIVLELETDNPNHPWYNVLSFRGVFNVQGDSLMKLT